MKRSMVPLLGIAVVVAILSTAVFYGLFAGKLRSASADVSGPPIVIAARDLDRGVVLQAEDLKVSHFKGALAGSFSNPEQLVGATMVAAVKQSEPLLEERVITRAPKEGSTAGVVPAGLRAVSVRISESDGIIALLRPGTKVDLQAVQDRSGSLELRTILQNVEVLAVSPQTQPAAGNRGPVSIVTVLARPEDADVLALADSGTRMRLSLRNPLDSQAGPRRPLSLGSVFQANSGDNTQAFPHARTLAVELQVLRANAEAVRELESKLSPSSPGDSLVIAPFAAGVDGRQLVQKLTEQHKVEVLSERTLSAGAGHPAGFRTGPVSGQLVMNFSAETGVSGKPSLRVRPEIVSQTAAGVESRRYEATVPAAGSFLVTGVLNEARDRATLQRMFPGQAWGNENLLVLVTSREASAGELTAATSQRGR